MNQIVSPSFGVNKRRSWSLEHHGVSVQVGRTLECEVYRTQKRFSLPPVNKSRILQHIMDYAGLTSRDETYQSTRVIRCWHVIRRRVHRFPDLGFRVNDWPLTFLQMSILCSLCSWARCLKLGKEGIPASLLYVLERCTLSKSS